MLPEELIKQGEHLMRICNSCRYCESFCAVFRSMEYRRNFTANDLSYLSNLCHDCRECYYACQYSPPHEWQINPPLIFAEIRRHSYLQNAWPRVLYYALGSNLYAVALVTILSTLIFFYGLIKLKGGNILVSSIPSGDFYQVISHHNIIFLFGVIGIFVLLALGVGFVRFCRSIDEKISTLFSFKILKTTLKEVFQLKYLDGGGWGCAYPMDESSFLRRWFHHFTFYGFLLCFLATIIAATYYYVFGWVAPYRYFSLPVISGILGGLGLITGPMGLLALKYFSNKEITDKKSSELDTALLVILLLTSITGILLLLFRHTAAMGWLLAIHLGLVMGFFLTLPYGKLVHAIYRFLAIAKYALERKRKHIIGA